MSRPFFSVVITTYNRVSIVMRCIESCFLQTFPHFEVIVVDDGSADGTVSTLQRRWKSRLRVVAHESNRGISPSRYTGVSHSRGEWIVVVDSDWELFPYTLQRLHDIILGLPKGVRVVRSRLLWDDGHISPSFVPEGPIGYEGRIRWAEEEGGHDAARCIQRTVFDATPYFRNRRGAMETLYELSLAKNETTICVSDVLGMEHTDASNSYLRNVDRNELIPRLLSEAPDMLWMAETALCEHGHGLERYGLRQYRELARVAALQGFLVGNRRKGVRYSLRYLRLKKSDSKGWVSLICGLLGPRVLAYGIFLYRIQAKRRGRGERGRKPA